MQFKQKQNWVIFCAFVWFPFGSARCRSRADRSEDFVWSTGYGIRHLYHILGHVASGVPRNFVRGGGSTNSVEDRGQRERGSGGSSPLVKSSGGSCNLVQEISFHIVKFS